MAPPTASPNKAFSATAATANFEPTNAATTNNNNNNSNNSIIDKLNAQLLEVEKKIGIEQKIRQGAVAMREQYATTGSSKQAASVSLEECERRLAFLRSESTRITNLLKVQQASSKGLVQWSDSTIGSGNEDN